MFAITTSGADELLKKFETFGAQIKELHSSIPQALKDWQVEDLHRKHPSQKTRSFRNRVIATTKILPHSRYEVMKSRQARKLRRRRKHTGVRPPSTRPILRAGLEEQLHARLITLASEAMKWP
jgi:hypothetical protein